MKKKEEFIGFSKHEYNPIVRPKTEALLSALVKEHRPRRVLEIGTFLGYSTAVMLEADGDVCVTTIEKDEENHRDACENLAKYGARVNAICCDAMDFLLSQTEMTEHSQKENCAQKKCCDNMKSENSFKNSHCDGDMQYDLIFLDGPKGQYHKYLPLLKKLLRVGGVLVCDDILFYGLVNSDGQVKHKHRSIVEHLRKFLNDLQVDTDFDTKIYDFEDGVSVSVRVK